MRRGSRLPLEQLQPYLHDLPVAPPPVPLARIDWGAMYGNDRPVEIEVGFGKGLFLVTEAPTRPDVNFYGIEIVRKYQLFTANRIAKRELHNVRLACADAKWVLRDLVPAGSVQVVHVYFPDPWWKTRHHKRRLFTEEFASYCAGVLRAGGQLRVVTDVPDYADMVRQTVTGVPALIPREVPGEHAPQHDMDYLTNFERKFRQEGKPIHRLWFERVDQESPQRH